MSNLARRGAVIALLGAMLACGGDEHDPLAPGDGPPTEPNPLAVAPVLDRAHADSAVVTPEQGGTVTATGADGTRYVLRVPAGAVLHARTIVMTPLAAMSGLPLSGGLAAGVHLEPDGLRLLEAATLTITPTTPFDASKASAFSYHHTGEDFHLYPATVTASSATIPVLHFSGTGVGHGTAADRAAQATRVPSRAEAALGQRVADALQRGAGDEVGQIFSEYRTEVIAPLVEQAMASNDLTVVRQAVAQLITFNRLRALVGNDDGTDPALYALLEKALKMQFAQAWERCVNQHDVSAVGELIAAARQAQLLGGSGWIDQEKALGCLRFELDFESIMGVDDHLDGVDQPVYGAHLKAEKVVLQVDFSWGTTGITGSGPLQHLGASAAPDGDCTYQIQGTGSTFDAVRLVYALEAPPDSLTDVGTSATVKEVQLQYTTGEPTEQWTYHCPDVPPETWYDGPARWLDAYATLHQSEAVAGSYVARLEPGSGALFASRDYLHPTPVPCEIYGGDVGVKCIENTRIAVHHHPQ